MAPMTTAIDHQSRRERREAVVREHVEAENRQDIAENVHFDTATILRQLGVLPDPGSE